MIGKMGAVRAGILVICVSYLLSPCEAVCAGGELLRSGGLSCEDKQSVLDIHNSYRQLVAVGNVSTQPPAVEMLQMGWDDELAKEAQYWADRCVFDHTPNRKLSRFTYGQNLGIWMAKPDPRNNKPDFKFAIDNWFNEVYKYGYDGTYNANSGHYSQVIWGKSNLVGCGYSYYLNSNGFYVKYYVCNYGPAGNVLGNPPYEKGRPACKPQQSVASKEFPGLCKTPNLPGAC